MTDLIAERTPEGNYKVHSDGVQEVGAEKGCHGNEVVLGLTQMAVRTDIAEPIVEDCSDSVYALHDFLDPTTMVSL